MLADATPGKRSINGFDAAIDQILDLHQVALGIDRDK